jgi:hypothetical protein
MLIPAFVFQSSHERLPMVRVRLAPANDPGRRIQLAGIARSFRRGQASDRLLVKSSAFGEGSVGNPFERFPAEREAGVESACGVFPSNQDIPCARPARALNFCGSDQKRREIPMICQPSPDSFFSSPASSQF